MEKKPKERCKEQYGPPLGSLSPSLPSPTPINIRPLGIRPAPSSKNRFIPLTYHQILSSHSTPPQPSRAQQLVTNLVSPSSSSLPITTAKQYVINIVQPNEHHQYVKRTINAPIVAIEPEFLKPNITPRVVAQ